MKILFVCTGNTCRSTMAEGIFKAIAKEKDLNVSCESAGIMTANGLPPSENAVIACNEIGIDISDYTSTAIQCVDLSTVDIFAVMTKEHEYVLKLNNIPEEKIYILGNGIPDPYGGSIDVYIICRDSIISAINKLIEDKLQ